MEFVFKIKKWIADHTYHNHACYFCKYGREGQSCLGKDYFCEYLGCVHEKGSCTLFKDRIKDELTKEEGNKTNVWCNFIRFLKKVHIWIFGPIN